MSGSHCRGPLRNVRGSRAGLLLIRYEVIASVPLISRALAMFADSLYITHRTGTASS